MTAKKPKPPHVWLVERKGYNGGWFPVFGAGHCNRALALNSITPELREMFPELRVRKYVRAEK